MALVCPSYVPPGHDKLFYFTGKVRAFWKDKIFFLDQRNAAVIGFENLYIDGERASQTDLHRLDAKVASSDWESAPVFYSYVVKYNSIEAPPWPYKLKGKKLWLARYAWTGPIPEAVEEQIQRQNVVYMPVTYYTGKLINLFDDKVLYGDHRNNIMAHLSDLYIYGQRADYRDTLMHFDHHTPVIHSFVSSLTFLTGKKYEGPEPHLPTWPIDNYGPSTWVAKFAWQGEMPDEFRQQLSRFQIIKITQWVGAGFKTGNIQRPLGVRAYSHDSSFSVSESAKRKESGATIIPEPLLLTTQKEAAIIKGSLLMANHKYGLINSYLDVIVFSTKNFYVNGEMFREGTALDDFFYERKVPLTAWIVPLPEPVLVFDVYVMWRAVCVWYGVPPKNMEAIKKRYDSGSIAGSVPEALNTASDNRYTLVLGEIVSISYNCGSARAKVGNKIIDITFKRKAVYMNGYKVHTKCSLTEIKQALESGIWTMLVYPVVIDNDVNNVMYTALALWQYQYQHYVSSDLLYRILLEGGSVDPESGPQNPESGDQTEEDRMGRHMTGLIVKTTPDYGIIETKSVTIEPSYVFFLRTDFYMDGMVLDGKQMLHGIERKRQVNLYARSAKHQEIKTFPITMYATLVWMGKKPPTVKYSSLELSTGSPTTDGATNGHSGDSSSSSPECESPDDISPGDGNFQKAVELIKPSTPTVEHKIGRFAFLRDRYGVIRSGSKSSSYTYILFDFSILWIDGDRLGSNEGLYDSIIHDEVQCNLIAYAIPNVKVGGHPVSMQASAVWMGKKPFHVEIPVIRCPLKAMEALDERVKSNLERKALTKKVSEYITKLNKPMAEIEDGSSAITDILAKVNLNESSAEELDSPEGLQEIIVDPRKPYVGKHISGRIVKLMKDQGIAMWRCAAKEGEVYIVFNRKNVFVNLCPMDEDYKLGQVKSCNFYVIPTKYKTVENYRVSLYATCGWIGSKPREIPAPGEQDHAHISLEHVYALEVKVGKNVTAQIVKLKTKTGIARWRSVAHGGDIFIEFEKALTCDTLQSYFDKDSADSEDFMRPCHLYVKPIEQKEVDGYTISLTALCGWIGKKPPHFPKPKTIYQPTFLAERLHVTPVDPALFENAATNKTRQDTEHVSQSEPKAGINALDSLSVDARRSPESKEKKKKKNRLEVWEDEEKKPEMEGKIVELHSSVGRLQGTDGNQHFFSRENSYLYGVCLSNVELWHVLVQDETVMYRLAEVTSKIEKLWIGPEKIEQDKAGAFIYEWCSKHAVPEGSRDLLIHQLQIANDNDCATKESS